MLLTIKIFTAVDPDASPRCPLNPRGNRLIDNVVIEDNEYDDDEEQEFIEQSDENQNIKRTIRKNKKNLAFNGISNNRNMDSKKAVRNGCKVPRLYRKPYVDDLGQTEFASRR